MLINNNTESSTYQNNMNNTHNINNITNSKSTTNTTTNTNLSNTNTTTNLEYNHKASYISNGFSDYFNSNTNTKNFNNLDSNQKMNVIDFEEYKEYESLSLNILEISLLEDNYFKNILDNINKLFKENYKKTNTNPISTSTTSNYINTKILIFSFLNLKTKYDNEISMYNLLNEKYEDLESSYDIYRIKYDDIFYQNTKLKETLKVIKDENEKSQKLNIELTKNKKRFSKDYQIILNKYNEVNETNISSQELGNFSEMKKNYTKICREKEELDDKLGLLNTTNKDLLTELHKLKEEIEKYMNQNNELNAVIDSINSISKKKKRILSNLAIPRIISKESNNNNTTGNNIGSICMNKKYSSNNEIEHFQSISEYTSLNYTNTNANNISNVLTNTTNINNPYNNTPYNRTNMKKKSPLLNKIYSNNNICMNCLNMNSCNPEYKGSKSIKSIGNYNKNDYNALSNKISIYTNGFDNDNMNTNVLNNEIKIADTNNNNNFYYSNNNYNSSPSINLIPNPTNLTNTTNPTNQTNNNNNNKFAPKYQTICSEEFESYNNINKENDNTNNNLYNPYNNRNNPYNNLNNQNFPTSLLNKPNNTNPIIPKSAKKEKTNNQEQTIINKINLITNQDSDNFSIVEIDGGKELRYCINHGDENENEENYCSDKSSNTNLGDYEVPYYSNQYNDLLNSISINSKYNNTKNIVNRDYNNNLNNPNSQNRLTNLEQHNINSNQSSSKTILNHSPLYRICNGGIAYDSFNNLNNGYHHNNRFNTDNEYNNNINMDDYANSPMDFSINTNMNSNISQLFNNNIEITNIKGNKNMSMNRKNSNTSNRYNHYNNTIMNTRNSNNQTSKKVILI